jgi:hypothetical protein
VNESSKPLIGRDAILGVLFVLSGSYAAMRHIAHDRIGFTVGLAASAAFAVLFVREITVGQTRRTVLKEVALALTAAVIVVVAAWLRIAVRG